MALEQADFVSQLDEQWPNGLDSLDRGDDHLRLIKSVLKKTFAGPENKGFNKAITVDPDVLNNLAKTIEELEKKITNTHAVGAIIFRDDATDPATLYPNTTWSLLSGDACIALATDKNVGTMSGNNTPPVPVPYHDHSASFAGDQMPAHSHDTNLRGGNQTGGATHSPNFKGFDTPIYTNGVSAGTPSGRVTVAPNGTQNATLDVRGQRRYICAWKRIK